MKKDHCSTTMFIERNNESIEIDIEALVHYSEDTEYGADADGNRGSYKCTIEDVPEVTAHDFDLEEVTLTDAEIESAKTILGDVFLDGIGV